MSLQDQLLWLAADSLTLEPLSTMTSYGAPQFSTTSQSLKCYVEANRRLVTNAEGVEEVSAATMYVMSSSASIGTQDRVTVPNGDQPRLLRVDVLKDADGQHHLELLIG